MATDKQYYQDSSLWGEEQYVNMSDIINNFRLFYVGDSKVINDIDRSDIIFHAKRGLQEIHYDALNDIKAFEMDIPDSLQIVLPRDFVKLVRISYVGSKGQLIPLNNSDMNRIIDTAPLQDDLGNISFDEDPGSDTYEQIITGTPIQDIRSNEYNENLQDGVEPIEDYSGARFGMDTANANVNSLYNISKKLGVINFSSQLDGKLVVIEYITDGMYDVADTDLKVHKLAEDFLYKYIAHEVIKNKFGVQEYIVRRMKKDAFSSLKNTKIRMMDIHPLDILKALRGRDKWIK
jgi:hypothetical protein